MDFDEQLGVRMAFQESRLPPVALEEETWIGFLLYGDVPRPIFALGYAE